MTYVGYHWRHNRHAGRVWVRSLPDQPSGAVVYQLRQRAATTAVSLSLFQGLTKCSFGISCTSIFLIAHRLSMLCTKVRACPGLRSHSATTRYVLTLSVTVDMTGPQVHAGVPSPIGGSAGALQSPGRGVLCLVCFCRGNSTSPPALLSRSAAGTAGQSR